MCVSMWPADFTGTILYTGRRRHPEHGWIDVLGYQNTAANLGAGPNAMLLHLPAHSVTSRQFVPTGRGESVLRDMVDAVRLPGQAWCAEGMDWMAGEQQAEVFEHDIYTVVLAADASRIPAALDSVEPRKRPSLNRDLFDFYAVLFPRYPVALCCFDNKDAAQAKPLMLWYRPLDHDLVLLPAIDCHTGAVPDLNANVPTDHWLLFGSDIAAGDWGEPVTYSKRVRRKLLDFLPPRVMGTYIAEPLRNGDFAIECDDLMLGRLDRIKRVSPA